VRIVPQKNTAFRDLSVKVRVQRCGKSAPATSRGVG
jgi:hypothetical protein